MSDQGHTTDGTTEIKADRPGRHAREHAGPDAQTITNVLQFPRDWFGPIEDLEPIDLNPPANSVELDPPPASIDFDQPASPVSAAAFWDEDAGALHQLVEFPGGEDSDEEASPAVRRSRPRRISLAFIFLLILVAGGSALVLATGSLSRRAPSVRLLHSQRRNSAHSSPHRQVPHSPVRQVTVTTTVTTTRRSPTPRHRKVAQPRDSVKAVSTANTKQSDSAPADAPTSHGLSAPVVHRQSASVIHGQSAPAANHDSSTPVSAAGDSGDTGCVQSPDSGCLP